MPSLLLITGPPGAGKSTVARAVAERFERSVLVEGDAFFGFLARGAIEPWLPESGEQNAITTRAAASATGEYARGGYVTVYDGVVGPWFLPTFLAATGLDALQYAMLLPSLERCAARIATRPGHGFTDQAATEKMHQEFARAEIDARHVLRDPPDEVDAVADALIAAFEAGTLRYQLDQ